MDLHFFMNLFLHLDRYLSQAVLDYGPWTYLLLFAIVFCETGLVVTPILPGDSLLFAAGALAAATSLDLWALLAILSVAEAEQILLALSQGNMALLTGISGVGKKTIEKLFIELKDKADKRLLQERGITPAKRTGGLAVGVNKTSWIKDLEQALLALGYRDHDVSAIVRDVAGKTTELGGFDSALRYALANLSRGANKSPRGNA
jgi:hypothetical protein